MGADYYESEFLGLGGVTPGDLLVHRLRTISARIVLWTEYHKAAVKIRKARKMLGLANCDADLVKVCCQSGMIRDPRAGGTLADASIYASHQNKDGSKALCFLELARNVCAG